MPDSPAVSQTKAWLAYLKEKIMVTRRRYETEPPFLGTFRAAEIEQIEQQIAEGSMGYTIGSRVIRAEDGVVLALQGVGRQAAFQTSAVTPGARGEKGDKGDPGQSIKGDKGDPGQSIKGDKGDPGQSIKGDKGDPGQSIKGDKGDSIKGDKGDPGQSIKGDKGDPGKDAEPVGSVRFDGSQGLSALEKAQALANLGITNRLTPLNGQIGQIYAWTSAGPAWVTPSGSSAPAPSPAPSPSPAPAPSPSGPSVITTTAPVLSNTAFQPGETVSMTAYATTTGSSQTVQKVILTARPPGATHASGPFLDFMTLPGVVMEVGTRPFPGSFKFPDNAQAGQWEFFMAILDANGAYTDGPSSFATVNVSASVALEYTPYAGPTDRHFPADAYDLPWSDRASFQTRIDNGQKIACRDHRDYSDGLSGPLIGKSGTEIYGISGVTKLSKGMQLADGSKKVVFSGFQDASVWMNGTTLEYQDIFIGLGRINVYSNGAKILRLTTLRTFEAQIKLDCTNGGYIRNTRILSPQWHGGGNGGTTTEPCFSFIGRSDGSSYGLTISGLNGLTPTGTTLSIVNIDDVVLLPSDIEVPEGNANNPAFYTAGVPDLAVFGLGGRTSSQLAMDIGANKLTLINPAVSTGRSGDRMRFRSVGSAAIYTGFKSGITEALNDNFAPGSNTNPRILAKRVGQRKKLMFNGVEVPTLSSSQITAAVGLVITETKQYVRWARPTFRDPGVPLGGANWKTDRVGKTSMRAELQALHDAAEAGSKVVVLTKNYFLDNSVFWSPNVYWVAADPATCGITCINDTFPAVRFKFNGVQAGGGMIDFSIMGGSEAILANEYGTYFVNSYFSHMNFRGQVNSNIALFKTNAWDNNHFDYCNFMDAAVHIRSYGEGTGEGPEVSYMDKQHFANCQFLYGGRMIDVDPKRSNNLLKWENCLIKGMTNGIYKLRDTNEPAFINCTFEDCTIAAGGVLCDYKGPVNWVGPLFKNNQATYTSQQGGFWEGLENIKGNNTGSFFKPTINNDERDQAETTVLNSDFGTQPTGFGDGTAADVSVVVVNTRCLAPEDSLWNSGIGAITHETQNDLDSNNNTHSVQARWLNWAPQPGTRLLRDRVVA